MLNISPKAGVEDLVSSLVQLEVEEGALSRPMEGSLGCWEAASKVIVGLRSFSFCSHIPVTRWIVLQPCVSAMLSCHHPQPEFKSKGLYTRDWNLQHCELK